MWNSKEATATKRRAAKISGYLTLTDAAQYVGMNATTLKDRVYSASYDDTFRPNDARNSDLYKSYRYINKRHYFTEKLFMNWADEYVTRPEVIASRTAGIAFPTTTIMMELDFISLRGLSNDDRLKALSKFMDAVNKLSKSDENLVIRAIAV